MPEAQRESSLVTPTWIRVAAAVAIAAFFISFLLGLFGYYGWWQVASGVFLVAFGVVWVYKLLRDRSDDAIDLIDE